MRKCSPVLEGKRLPNVDDPSSWRTLSEIWRCTTIKYGDKVALVDPHHMSPKTITFKQLELEILQFSESLRQSGILPDEKIAIFAENSCRWLIADQGVMAMGAVDVVRGSRSSIDELLFIYSHSDSVALIVDSKELWDKLLPSFNALQAPKFVVLLWCENFFSGDVGSPFPIHTYEEFLSIGQQAKATCTAANEGVQETQYLEIQPDDVATIVYTSGTTGNPKGVMLTHSNLLHQVVHLWEVVQPDPGDRFLSLLPPWHAYERSVEYFSLSRGSEQVYTNIKCLKDDLKQYPPHYMVSVPLVFDTLYSGVKRELSKSSAMKRFLASTLLGMSMVYMRMTRIYQGRDLHEVKTYKSMYIGELKKWITATICAAFLLPIHRLAHLLVYRKILSAIGIKKAGISGGGSLPPHVDAFYEAVGITLLNGYGLTETSPVVAARNADNNILGTIGKILSETEIRIVDVNSGETLPPGEKGLLKVRGPQIMKGYYKNKEATRKAVDEEGWLDTGDLGWLCPDIKTGAARCCGGNVVLDGRAKDTIVLSTGENIEPIVIEEAAMQSKYIQQIVVVGQDQRRLGALIVVNKDELRSAGFMDAVDACSDKIRMLIRKELHYHTAGCPEKIGPFLLLNEAFTVDNDMLTPTMKVRRSAVTSKYQSQIKDLF
ncbi:hypothetical protein GOP47_0019399 [Adiantum capillus-veneris]|uniref:AMP-dependent synthetase/ligase domain-containing protein n=1 Tax=Adiantum capillus-veneris TaxID=13818 RepID=A0A9D4Z7T2_ADICA|nr:hypothetical protein GOP47_0019399 [Adiantum capillus-veneris]